MKNYSKFIKGLLMVTQLGFDLVVPPLVLCLGANLIMNKFGIGSWIMIAAVIIGLITAISIAADFFKKETAKSEKEKSKSINFNSRI